MRKQRLPKNVTYDYKILVFKVFGYGHGCHKHYYLNEDNKLVMYKFNSYSDLYNKCIVIKVDNKDFNDKNSRYRKLGILINGKRAIKVYTLKYEDKLENIFYLNSDKLETILNCEELIVKNKNDRRISQVNLLYTDTDKKYTINVSEDDYKCTSFTMLRGSIYTDTNLYLRDADITLCNTVIDNELTVYKVNLYLKDAFLSNNYIVATEDQYTIPVIKNEKTFKLHDTTLIVTNDNFSFGMNDIDSSRDSQYLNFKENIDIQNTSLNICYGNSSNTTVNIKKPIRLYNLNTYFNYRIFVVSIKADIDSDLYVYHDVSSNEDYTLIKDRNEIKVYGKIYNSLVTACIGTIYIDMHNNYVWVPHTAMKRDKTPNELKLSIATVDTFTNVDKIISYT